MKVLLANKYFYRKGGDAVVFFATAELLQERGQEVIFFSMRGPKNHESPFDRYFVSSVEFNGGNSILQQVKSASRILYSFEAKKKMSHLLRESAPDIAHLHNIYHQISPSIIHSLRKKKIPIVMTLHDYKITCPAYSLLSSGGPCERCAQKAYYKILANQCLKESFSKSALAMMEMYLHHVLLKIYEKVDVFISPSAFLKRKVEEMGFRGRIVHIPNFIDSDGYSPCFDFLPGTVVYFGRLSREKGVATLIDAAKGLDVSLKIIGTGPEKETLEAKVAAENIKNVSFLGYKSGEDLHSEISRSAFAVVPSECYENNPLSILEAFALGKPVIGARIGGIPELVKDGQTGYTFESGNVRDLQEKIEALSKMRSDITEMGRTARQFVEKEFNPEIHYQRLMEVYQAAREKRGVSNGSGGHYHVQV